MTLRLVAPELDLLKPAQPTHRAQLQTRTLPEEHRAQLMKLRDEFVRRASRGRYADAAGCEWRELPSNWRMALLMLAGVGVDVADLDTLANREWLEMPQPERDALREVVRGARRHLGGLTALAARV